MKVISIGSCLSYLTTVNLNMHFGWRLTHNVTNVRSDVLVDFHIEHSKPQLPLPWVECWVPCDHVPSRSWPLFKARDTMRGVIEALRQEQAA